MSDLIPARRDSHSGNIDVTRITDDEIRTLVDRYFDEHEQWTDASGPMWAIAKLLGHDGYYHPGRPFEAKIKRILNRLADNGVLVKRRGIGMSYRNIPRYATPEYSARYDREQEQRRSEHEAMEARLNRAVVDMSAAGFEVAVKDGAIILSVEDAEIIARERLIRR